LSTAGAVGGGAGGAERAPRQGSEGTDHLAAAVFAVLVAACFLAFFLTQRLKHKPNSVQTFQLTSNFAPVPSGRHKREQISFKLARAERVTVAVIDVRGNVVATLLVRHPVPRYKQLSLRWNGHRGTARSYRTQTTASGRTFLIPQNRGRLAPAGEYRVRLTLSGQPNPVLSPRSFALVRP
jgi:hypothetical protein